MLQAQLYQKSKLKYRYFCPWSPKLRHLKCLFSSQSILRSSGKSALGNTREKLPNLRTFQSKIGAYWLILEQLTYPPHLQMLLGGLNDNEYLLHLGSDTKLLPRWHHTYHIPDLVGILALTWKGLCQECWQKPKWSDVGVREECKVGALWICLSFLFKGL